MQGGGCKRKLSCNMKAKGCCKSPRHTPSQVSSKPKGNSVRVWVCNACSCKKAEKNNIQNSVVENLTILGCQGLLLGHKSAEPGDLPGLAPCCKQDIASAKLALMVPLDCSDSAVLSDGRRPSQSLMVFGACLTSRLILQQPKTWPMVLEKEQASLLPSSKFLKCRVSLHWLAHIHNAP